MRDPEVLVRGFDRPNIWLGVGAFVEEEARRTALMERIASAPKPGIVYCVTRRQAEEMTERLVEAGHSARCYHAGRSKADREAAHTAFMEDVAEILVATKAFGMGIDKPNVRFVYHLGVSDSLDSYFQEVGRAGRDGQPAEAILFFTPKDFHTQQFLSSAPKLEEDEVEQVLHALADADEPMSVERLREESGLSLTRANAAALRLEEAGAVEILPTGEVAPLESPPEDDLIAETTREAVEGQERRRQFQRSRLEMMERYAACRACYREFLLNYFGEPYAGPCGQCGACQSGSSADEEAGPTADGPFAQNERVRHVEWGDGTVLRLEGAHLVGLFDEVGYKTLSVEIVEERGLLHPRVND